MIVDVGSVLIERLKDIVGVVNVLIEFDDKVFFFGDWLGKYYGKVVVVVCFGMM